MRYAPMGLCLNDFAVLPHGADYHLIHLQGPWTPRFDESAMETSYGHAVSRDLVNWQGLAPCFGVGIPGRFDDSAVWTMHPFPYGEGTAMAYTGVHRDGWAEQSIGLAYSDRRDGTGWQRVQHDPVLRVDPRWYRTGPGMAWRDPFVVRTDEQWAMVVCAADGRLGDGKAGCVGFATSDDLLHWRTSPPLITPGDIDELECPILERDGTGWLLLGCHGAAHRIEAWRADNLLGQWRRLGPIGPAGPYAPRLFDGPSGERLLLHTVQRKTGLTNAGKPCRGMLAQPKLFDVSSGTPELRWWPALDECLGAPTENSAPGVATFAVGEPGFLPLRVDGENPTLGLDFDAGRVRLRHPDGSILQQHKQSTPIQELRVLLVGEFIEIYADDVFVLCASDYSGTIPRLELQVAGRREPVPLRPIHLPPSTRDDASAVLPAARPQHWPFTVD